MSLAVFELDRAPVAGDGGGFRAAVLGGQEPQGLDQRLRKLAQGHGFYSGLYLHLGHAPVGEDQDRFPPSRLIASSPIALRQYGAALAGGSMVRRAATAHRPFAWTSVEERLPGLSGRHVGLSVPVQDHAAGPALVALIGQDLDLARGLASSAAGALMLAAADLHQAALAGMRPAATSGGALTVREIECLRLAAVGRTVADSAAILGITGRTVEFHLKNVTEKLRAANKIHAVAIAVSHGLVSLRA
jgi:hypothetical protein